MIESITYKDLSQTSNGYAPLVKMLKRKINKPINFKEGVNILFAPNGTGKSTIISDLARYHFCYQTGRLKITKSSINDISWFNPLSDKDTHKFKNGVEIVSDGQVFYISSNTCNGDFSLNNDYMSKKDFINRYMEVNSSSGEANIKSFLYLYNNIKNIKYDKFVEFAICDVKEFFGEDYYNSIKNCIKYIENPILPKSKPTILIDELDSNTDIVNSVYLFKIIKQISSRYQIIMASHSPLILELKDVNIIELISGYKNKCKKAIKNINIADI